MTITPAMDLSQLAERMGNAEIYEAISMRTLLNQSYGGDDTREIPDDHWQLMLEISTKINTRTTPEKTDVLEEERGGTVTLTEWLEYLNHQFLSA